MRMVFLMGLALAACAPKVANTAAAGDATVMTGSCDAAKVQDLLDRPAASVSADAKARSGAKAVRTYVSGSPVTMDYRADRLNIETDANGTIDKLSCG